MSLPRLFLSHDAESDWLIALEYGRVDDGAPEDSWTPESEHFAWFSADGAVVGFVVLGLSRFDVDDPDVDAIWSEPRFDAPFLGLGGAPAGEIILAARAAYRGRPSMNRRFFLAAVRSKGRAALIRWRQCLEAGDSMAHFGLGYTLYDLGRHREAYSNLRHYTQLAPCSAWVWCWFGKAAAAIGETEEAREAFGRALALEDEEDETDARELLDALGGETRA